MSVTTFCGKVAYEYIKLYDNIGLDMPLHTLDRHVEIVLASRGVTRRPNDHFYIFTIHRKEGLVKRVGKNLFRPTDSARGFSRDDEAADRRA